jgi:hypothetical protein
MKNGKSVLAPSFFCGMLRFRTREAAYFLEAFPRSLKSDQRFQIESVAKNPIIPQAVEIVWEFCGQMTVT